VLAAILKETKITNLKCAAAPKHPCQYPLNFLTTNLRSRAPVSRVTNLVPKEEPHSLSAWGATPRCNHYSTPPVAQTDSRVFAFLSAPVDTHTSTPVLSHP
jgi:hypothetical protein